MGGRWRMRERLGLVSVVCMLGCTQASAAAPRNLGPWLSAHVVAQPIETIAEGQSELSLLFLERPERDMPVSVRLSSSSLPLTENRLGWADVVDPRAREPRIRTRFLTPSLPGDYRIDADVTYVICGPKRCREKRGRVHWQFTVDPSAPEDRP